MKAMIRRVARAKAEATGAESDRTVAAGRIKGINHYAIF